MDEKVKVIKLDTTYLEHFQLLLSWLNFATGHYQGDVVTLDKRTPQEQAPVAFLKLFCKNWIHICEFATLAKEVTETERTRAIAYGAPIGANK